VHQFEVTRTFIVSNHRPKFLRIRHDTRNFDFAI
jgi:hypothetical protein